MRKITLAKQLMVILLTIKLTFMWSLCARHSSEDLTHILLVFIAILTVLSYAYFTIEETEIQREKVTCASSHSLVSSRTGLKHR